MLPAVRGEHRGLTVLRPCLLRMWIGAARDEVAIASARIRRTDQQLIRQILARKVTFADRLIELMSTHPNMVKRLRALRG